MKSLLVAAVGLVFVAASPLEIHPKDIVIPQPRVVTQISCERKLTVITLAEGDVLRWKLTEKATKRRCGIKIKSTSGGQLEINCPSFDLPENVVFKITDSVGPKDPYRLKNGPTAVMTQGDTLLQIKRNKKKQEVSFECIIRVQSSEEASTTSTTTPTTTAATTTTTPATTTTAYSICNTECGRTAPNNRIVGGSNATIENHPYQVGLASGTFLFCGGTLINNQWVLTAAHCTVDGHLDGVYVGGTPFTVDENKLVAVERYINHPEYNSVTLNNDIALVKLSSPVSFSESVYPACLPQSATNDYENVIAIISGWGTLASGGSRPGVLQQAQVKTLSNQQCTNHPFMYESHWVTDNMICALGDGIDSCQGDSGGPMITTDGEVIGIVSWGAGCAISVYPGVYTRVTQYLDFINDNMGCN